MTDYVFENVSRTIHAECKAIHVSLETYDVHINPRKSCSQPLEAILTKRCRDDYFHDVFVSDGLFQVITDNYDIIGMSSQKNKLLRHCSIFPLPL